MLVPQGAFGMNGDLSSFGEWGKRFWEIGAANFYYDKNWQYSLPNYPPLSTLIYALLSWIFDQKQLLLLSHNLIKIPTSSFIISFYKTGYNLLLKLPAILGDLGLSILIYKIVLKLTKDKMKSVFAAVFYILNPLTIFLSGVWGQAESLIAFLGILSFWLLYSKKVYLSIPILFLSLFFKPTWIIFLPFYAFVIFNLKPKFTHILIGVFLAFGVFYLSSKPFAGNNIINFAQNVVIKNSLPATRGTAKTTISAFNFWAIFTRIDLDFDTLKLMFIPTSTIGVFLYLLINWIAFKQFVKTKNKLLGIIIGIFVIGLGSFLFLTNMLERYFFACFAPFVVLMFVKPRLVLYMIIANIILFLNLIWAFYRRTSDEIGHPFTDNNFLLIRVLSLILVGVYIKVSRLLSSSTSDTIKL